ncbi:CHRD domain-containing protein [Rufibacter roseolus]|uniref:CHRD domain-containing protein n=1 Tax=Rufibacter roseolus TaxID=2817375 RepID=UPI001B310D8D|nr:CHRD domain-containing protein [Rufibacter roseolus]
MKNFIYALPVMVMSLCLSSCDTELVEPQNVAAVAKTADAQSPYTYTAHLRPEEETREVISNATGQIILRLSKDGTQLYYKLIVANMESVLFGHLHMAPAGENGPVVVDLVGSVSNPSGVIAEGIITSASLKGPLAGKTLSDLIAAIEAGNIYTNVHSPTYPAGEIRGQVK